MAAHVNRSAVRLPTRNGLDRSDKYPSAIAALTNIKASPAYLDGELCGIDAFGPPSFACTQSSGKRSSPSLDASSWVAQTGLRATVLD
jgi:ATP-dependent DNA ligase